MSGSTTILVAIFWPNEGYGIPRTVPTMDEARGVAEKWYRDGFGKGDSKIHIIETTKKITEWQP
jgi:hypothetical protein